MATAIKKTFFKCEVCGTEYSTEKQATECEKKPKSEDKGAKVGDKVKITNGDGSGETATVTKVFVFDREWGHYAWKRYWHTVGITADLETWGTRLLTFDSYELIK